MGLPVLIIGRSGTGKSASTRNFQSNSEVGIINVLGKELPFKNELKPYTTDDYVKIKELLQKGKAPSYVIDDAGYLMVNEFMRGHSSEGSGNAIFTFYNKLADNFWGLIRFITYNLPREKIVYLFMHEESDEMGLKKPKTIGKMLDDKVCIEGLFTIVLRSTIDNGKYVFKTQSEGYDVAKSPMGMFDSVIDNDLKYVDTKIREYYNLKKELNSNE